MGDIGTVIIFGVAVLIIVEIFVIGHATVESRKELQRLTRLLVISLSFQHSEFSIVDRTFQPSRNEYNRSEFPLYMHGYEWTCIAKGDIDEKKPAKVIGFRGDKLVVSTAESEA